MSEIDVSKYKNCPYWHYGHCQNNIINVLNSECLVHQNCFIKKILEQLQQLKQENEELKNEIEKDKKIKALKADIKHYKRALYKISTENEELRARNSRGTLAFLLEKDFKKEQKIEKYKQCLDEIKGIAQKMPLTSYYKKQILQLIKQTKEGGE